MRRLAVALACFSSLAHAQTPPATDKPLSPEEMKAIEGALGKDTAAATQQAPAAPQQPAAGTVGGLSGVLGLQALNPQISAIVDFAGGYFSDDKHLVLNGDDPAHTGMNVEEVELAFSAVVDPYLRADVFLTIPNTSGIEVEEAFVTSLSLPAQLQIRAGVMRALFGRQNTQHLHQQFFTRRPEANALFLGADGLRAPAIELSWLVPLPFFLKLTAEALSVGVADPSAPLASFGGGSATDLTYLGRAETFIPFTDSTSLLLGTSFATGITCAGVASGGCAGKMSDMMTPTGSSLRSYLYGADAYFKWKPLNVSETYMSVAWQTEFFLRELPDLSDKIDLGLYSQVVWQVDRRWFLGVRGEYDRMESVPTIGTEYAASASLTWQLSEFAVTRLYGEARFPSTDLGDVRWAAFLQIEASIGAHGAHPF